MNKLPLSKDCRLRPEMTILEVVNKHRQTQAVFEKYDRQAGECLCCQALFSSLKEVAVHYGLDLENFLADLEEAAGP